MTRLVLPCLALTTILALAACAGGGEAGSAGTSGRPSASATLAAPDGSPRGTAMVAATDSGGVRLTARVQGLTPGAHGIHIHMTGNCTPPDFASAGGHWNPMMKQHGRDNPQGMHMGDLPNVTVAADGTGSLSFLIPAARIVGGADALLDSDGAAIVVHASADDMKSDPSGNSGGRIACGVFRAGR